jgi:histidyl-tRNA synthetase
MEKTMTLNTQPYKGARDFYPEDMRVRKYMFGKLREVCERFGYEEYDAPILESMDLYLAKSGEEIVNEQTYAFEDRGGRKVVIRPEMTPTVSRMVAARRQELAYPLRWYSIPNLWRYERPQKGRLREHWQLNVDIFGVAGSEAELEMITIASEIFKAFGARDDMYAIKLNSRKFMDFVLGEYLGMDAVQQLSLAKLIDRIHKIDRAEFIAQADAICTPSQRENGIVEKLLDVLAAQDFAQLPAAVQGNEAIQRLQQVLEQLAAVGIGNAAFDVTIMRGFDYYTDIVFEVNDTNPDNNRSMFGGGRYDGLVGLFGVEPVPTVGFGMGDATLLEFLKGHHLLPEPRTETDLYVVLAGDVLNSAQKPIADLRGMGLNVAVDVSGKKIGNQFKTADKKGVPYVLVIGEKELEGQQFTLKNLKTGQEEAHGLERIVSIVKDHRRGRE